MPKYSVTVVYDCSSGTQIEAADLDAARQVVNDDPDLTAIPPIDDVDLGDAYKVFITNVDDPKDFVEVTL